MAEKRLALDQVPFTSGGGGASVFQSVTYERTTGPVGGDVTPVGQTTFIPVGGAGATLINFTLQNDSAVYFAAYGTAHPGSGSETDIGIRIDGTTDYTGTATVHISGGTEYGGNTCTLALPMTSGAHTAEVVFRTNAGGIGQLDSSATRPTRISAAWMDPVYGVGSMTKLQAVLANPPPSSFTHPGPNLDLWAAVPGSLISFSLPINQDVYFSAYGSILGGGGWQNTQVGLRVDGTDYPGTGSIALSAYEYDNGVCVMQALSLASGAHSAELIVRRHFPGWATVPVGVETNSTYPLVLNVLFTKPEQLYQAETVANPAQIDAGDAGSPGVALKVSLSDHEHPVNTATLNTDIQPTGTANNAGVSTKLPRADHVHRLLLEGQEEGVAVASRPKINFIGADVTVTDNVGSDRLDVTFTSPASDYVGKFEQGTKPTIVQIPDGKWGFWWDTSLSEMWQVRNRGGTMYAVELNPLP